MTTKCARIFSLVLISLFILFVVTGCSMLGISNQEEQQKPENPPLQLEELELSLEHIFKILQGPTVLEEFEKAGENSEKLEEKEKITEPQEKEASGGQQGEGTQSSQGEEEKQTEQQSDPWMDVTKEIDKLHNHWNDYTPEISEKGVSKEKIEGFSNALNKLTESLEEQNKEKTLIAASKLYSYIPEFYAVYETEFSPEVKRMIFYTRDAMIYGMVEKWSEADTDIRKLKESWDLVKNDLKQSQKEDSKKLSFSLEELETVIKEKNKELVDIKGRITLYNIKAIEQKSQGQNQDQS